MKHSSSLRLLALCLLATAAADADQVYKWRDETGKLHFSDRPPQHRAAERLQLRRINTIETASVSALGEVFPDSADVILYGTAWCGACKTAKRYFREKGIRYQEYDVEKSGRGKRDYQRLKGQGVPIILVGKRRMDGFSATRFEQMMKP